MAHRSKRPVAEPARGPAATGRVGPAAPASAGSATRPRRWRRRTSSPTCVRARLADRCRDAGLAPPPPRVRRRGRDGLDAEAWRRLAPGRGVASTTSARGPRSRASPAGCRPRTSVERGFVDLARDSALLTLGLSARAPSGSRSSPGSSRRGSGSASPARRRSSRGPGWTRLDYRRLLAEAERAGGGGRSEHGVERAPAARRQGEPIETAGARRGKRLTHDRPRRRPGRASASTPGRRSAGSARTSPARSSSATSARRRWPASSAAASRRLAGPLSPILYMRTAAYASRIATTSAIGRLVFLRPLELRPWSSGVADDLRRAVRPDAAAVARRLRPRRRRPGGCRGRLEGVATLPDLREALGGRRHDEAVAETLDRLDRLPTSWPRRRSLAEPLRRELQSADPAERRRPATAMRASGWTRPTSARAWHHLPRDRRDLVARRPRRWPPAAMRTR